MTPSNVPTLMRWLSMFVGYKYDDADVNAVSNAPGGRIEYPLVGTPPLRVSLAPEPDAEPVIVKVSGDMSDVLAARIETLVGVLAETRSA